MSNNFAEVSGETLIAYPYGFSQLQAENPYTNFGDNYDVAFWFPQTNAAIDQGYTLAEVVTAPRPPYDENNQICALNANPTLVEGVWVLEWTITNMTPEQKAEHDQQVKSQNKSQAESLLKFTDWSALPSVADPQQSNPYLVNQNEFFAYRSQVRAIAVNPPSTPVTNWPVMPPEVWA